MVTQASAHPEHGRGMVLVVGDEKSVRASTQRHLSALAFAYSVELVKK